MRDYEETAKVEARGEAAGLMLVVLGRKAPSTHALPASGSVTIGRAPRSTVRIAEPSISRLHATLQLGPPLAIVDEGSANGVRVRSHPISPHSAIPIRIGEPVELGGVAVVVHRAQLPAGAPEPGRRSDPSEAAPVIHDEVMQRIYALVQQVAGSDLSVLLLGETGVGKEVIAEALHRASHRASGPLVRLNCSAISETLIESELFGHARGAFTGATREKPGLLESASGGTVFLDEIGELPLSLQAKLLRVLDDRKVLRVGSVVERPIDARFVAATNRDLTAEVQRGAFRQDLYYRLNGMTIELPPLRERPAEILPLAERFLERALERAGRFHEDAELTPAAMRALQTYRWPGNIRELRNAIDRAAVLATSQCVDLDALPPEVRGEGPPAQRATDVPQALSPAGQDERARIIAALEACAWNQTRAAERLGFSRRTLVKRLDRYQIPRPRKDR